MAQAWDEEHEMENKDTFSGYNPIINFVFFIGAVVFGMFFVHPVFMMCSLLLASVYYVTVKKSASWKFLIACCRSLQYCLW